MRKAIILYSSITGNTEQIAQKFYDVFKAYNFDVQLEKVHPSRDWVKEPVYFDDCDILCIGSPVIAALPYKELSSVIGWSGKHVEFFKGARPDPSNPPRLKLGVAFATFGGTVAGPRECIATLELEKEYLQLYGFTPVAQFACPGKQLRHGPVDELNEKLKIDIDDAQALLQRYKEDPKASEFEEMDLKTLEIVKRAAESEDTDQEGNTLMAGLRNMAENDPLGNGMPGSRFFHYDLQNRPNERDLTMADLFIREIIEDFFLTMDGEIRRPLGTIYSCII